MGKALTSKLDPAVAGTFVPLDVRGNPMRMESLIATLRDHRDKVGAGSAREVCRLLSIPRTMFHSCMAQSPEFREIIADARAEADDKVEASLYDRAVGYTAIETRKTEGLDKNGMRVESETVVEKEIAPDVTAGKDDR